MHKFQEYLSPARTKPTKSLKQIYTIRLFTIHYVVFILYEYFMHKRFLGYQQDIHHPVYNLWHFVSKRVLFVNLQ